MRPTASPWTIRVGAVIFAALVFWWVFKKPAQPPGYQRHLCKAAWSGAYDECTARRVDIEQCRRIAAKAHKSCLSALPEKDAEPN